MTIMAEKLKEAGVKVPSVQERVWRIVRDNPGGITAARVTDILGASVSGGSGVSSLLSQMEARKMVRSRKEMRRVTGPRGSVVERGVNVYVTDMREYEILPLRRKETAATRAMDATKAVVAQVKAAPTPTTVIASQLRKTPTVNEAEEFVERLTIAEARAVFGVLNKMFGEKA